MRALLPLLALVVAAPARAQFGGPVYTERTTTPVYVQPKPSPTDSEVYKKLVADQKIAVVALQNKQTQEINAALKNPSFTSNERAAALAKAGFAERLAMTADVAAVFRERLRGFEQMTARHAAERSKLVSDQAKDREVTLMQIAWAAM